ncbi:mandelate racemase/muconate lactonizing enzyme family protein [Natronorubrum sp. FCH18a]|uniref:mandelate racemase/muconate lactonizing enzyme family protein n=1 Tax=Natronorubrum sp. FCH18a TaxID=3447018 RepID=UPI003F519962
MQITDIAVTPVVIPMEAEIKGSSYQKENRGTLVITLETDEGVISRIHSGDVLDTELDKADQLVSFIENEIADILVGRDLFRIEATWEALMERSRKLFAYQTGERQLFVHAIGAVDIAMWDAIGKAVDKPLYQLWGGYRDEVPIAAIGGYYGDGRTIDDLIDEMVEYTELGIGGVKLKVGGRTPERDLERLAAIREAMGEDFFIACDANQGYEVEEAVDFARGAADYDIDWFEEPVVWHDQYAGMRTVRQRSTVPVTAGQSESTVESCRRLIEGDAVDIINLDASIAGGPTAWRKVAAMADAFGVAMAHHEEPHISMHLLASIPNGRCVECFHPDFDPVWHEMIVDKPTVEDGTLTLPDQPGIGLELDDGFIKEHALEL